MSKTQDHEQSYQKMSYETARKYFYAKPLALAQLGAAAPKDDTIATDQGMVQFHIFSQTSDDPKCMRRPRPIDFSVAAI
ncbi:hypothetical protein [Sinorhizobium meliloti]|uniref:hypothetical protein n=1 Tax=Rhizobium meliloti TaxID=382 RepID=UPI0013E35FB7|nr:hypothetical protein [Sinorhizobium meliloti]